MISGVDRINQMMQKYQNYDNGTAGLSVNTAGNGADQVGSYGQDETDFSSELKESKPTPPAQEEKKEGSGIGKMLLGLGMNLLNTVLGGIFGGGGGGGAEQQKAAGCGGG